MKLKRHPLALGLPLLCLLLSATAYAQDVPRVEIGLQVTSLKVGSFRLEIPGFDETQRGFGGRLTVNVTEHFSIEGEVNVFPKDFRLSINKLSNVLNEKLTQDGVLQAVGGIKYGVRSNRFGLFAKARPGITRVQVLTERKDLPGAPTPINDFFRFRGAYCLDIGGVFEIYPSKHTQVRFDIGDTRIRYKERKLATPSGAELPNFNPNYTRNNLQFSMGFGFRF
jgi:Outer membrane protein beta-barrel domain